MDAESGKEGTEGLGNGKPLGAGWNRTQASYWITQQRRQDLMSIALQLPAGATPTDAITRAIELARAHVAGGQLDQAELLDAVDTSIASGFAATREALEGQAAAIADMGKGLRSIHRLLTELAGAEGIDAGPALAGEAKAPPFRDWLNSQLALAGLRPQRSAVASGQWRSVERAGEKSASVEFNLELAAVDGKPVAPELLPQASRARFEGLEAAHPFATADWQARLFFVCQPVGSEWVVHLHKSGQDGSAGAAIGQARA